MIPKISSLKQENTYPIFHFRPLVFMLIPTAMGVLAVWNALNGNSTSFYLCLGGVVLLCFIPVLERKRCMVGESAALIALSMIFFLASGAITALNVQSFKTVDLTEGYYTVRGTVTDISVGETVTTLTLTDVTFSSFEEKIKTSHGMQIFVQEFEENTIRKGDVVSCYANVALQDGEGEYAAYHILNGYKYYAFTTQKTLSVDGRTKDFFLRARLKGESVLFQNTSSDIAAIAAGLLFGDTDGMEETTLESFRKLGIAHIFAVSGLHIGFLCGLLLLIFRKMEKRNPIRFLIPTICVFLYAGICGFTPSALRAAIMCATTLFMTMIGAPIDRFNGILVSGIVILFLNPMDLFSYGFQLSYVCVLSLLFISPIFKDFLRFLPEKVGESLSVVFGVQCGVFPLQMLLFGYASPISILLNLVLVPIISVVYSLAVIMLALVLIIPKLGGLLLFVAVILKLISQFVNGFVRDWMIISGLDFTKSLAIYYAGFISASPMINLKGKVKAVVFGVLMTICAVITLFFTLK